MGFSLEEPIIFITLGKYETRKVLIPGRHADVMGMIYIDSGKENLVGHRRISDTK